MKRRTKIILIALVAVVALGVAAFSAANFTLSKGHAGLLFRGYRQEFEEVATQLLFETGAAPTLPPGVTDATVWDSNSGCVDFYMGGKGLAPSSTYWGVVYTTQDRPVGFQGMTPEYIYDGQGWYWQEEDGDNRAYVTKLDDHWYLYEMRF